MFFTDTSQFQRIPTSLQLAGILNSWFDVRGKNTDIRVLELTIERAYVKRCLTVIEQFWDGRNLVTL